FEMSYIGSAVKNLNDHPFDVMQVIRDNGYISAALSYDDDTIWIGGTDGVGLIKGVVISQSPLSYRFDQVYWGNASESTITDVMVDPFDSDTVWFTNWSGDGVFMTVDGGNNFSSMTTGLNINGDYSANVLVSDLLEPQQRSLLVGVHSIQSSVPGVLFLEGTGSLEESGLYMNLSVGGLAFNPVELGGKRAVAGPQNCQNSMAMLGTNGSWIADSTVSKPNGLPSSEIIKALRIPLGVDGDDEADAFAVVHQKGTSFMGLYYSYADTYMGSPGGQWNPLTGEIDFHGPTSVTVHPKDGNLLWVTTRTGSAFTLYGNHYIDNAQPFIPLKPTVTSSTTGDTLKVMAQNISADTVSTLTTLPLLNMVVKVTNTIDLEWLAPGDDGTMPGWADR
ncbi:hypothetical protein KAJ77_05865, partial [bacterium]|nr:hypothetical protein [bacterium]